MLKQVLTIGIGLCLFMTIAACSQRNSSTSSQAEQPSADANDKISSSASISAEEKKEESVSTPESTNFVEDDAFYQSILITYGGVIQTDEQNKPYLSATKAGLFFTGDWQDPEELTVGGYFIWYLTMVWKEDIPFEELQEKYKSPFGPDTGWFFPQEYFEPLVQKYFDVSTEYLRSDSTIYNTEYEGYYIGGGGGIGDTPAIVLNGVESDGDLRRLSVRLDYKYENAQNKILAVKLEPDGSYKFESYITVKK